jgi:aromatic ring-opening dioxygenase catalytic subunit (LigB family)
MKIMSSAFKSAVRLPTVFLSHGGGPAHALDFGTSSFSAIDKNSKSASFLRSLPTIIEKETNVAISDIRCFVVISGHWEEKEFTVDYQSNSSPSSARLIYDYHGFPKEAYPPYFTYPVSTDLSVADRVFELLSSFNTDLSSVSKKDRGFDHGTFMPLKISFPEAKIPIVQVSLKSNMKIEDHLRLGELLRPLRDEGVLIIGSGSMTHNLGGLDPSSSQPDRRTKAFTDFMFEKLTSIHSEEDYQKVKRFFIYESDDKIPFYHFHHPTTEHFIPLFVAFAAGMNSDQSASTSTSTTTASSTLAESNHVKRIYEEIVLGTMAVDSYIFF